MTTTTLPPHSIDAEESLLGACLISREAAEAAALTIRSGDYYKPAHQHIHDAVLTVLHSGAKPDAVSVADELRRTNHLDDIGGTQTLNDLMVRTPGLAQAARYASIVVDYAVRRRLLGVASEIRQLAADQPERPLADCLDTARTLIADIELPVGQTEPDDNLDEFVDALPEHVDWIVSGLLERRDRMLIVGPEGYGKTMLLRQMAVTISQGIHPFTFRPIVPLSVLYIDLENPPNLVRRKLHAIRTQARLASGTGYNPDRFHIVCRDGGIDVTKRADNYWLLDKVSANPCDVVFLGPIYQTYVESPNEETVVRKVTNVLDMIRTRFDVALVMETHAPHAAQGGRRAWRPIGSSLWLRWPEFILGLDPNDDDGGRTCRIQYGKLPRDEREFPDVLSKGGLWPWTSVAG